jgi:tripartite-type tricarboxylate transporter receptor subunit TctC
MIRRRLLRALPAGALCAAARAFAQPSGTQPAAAYPTKPVRIVCGYQAGGPTDLVARLLAAQLQQALGQPFLVENKPGAGGNLASEAVAAATPDGYTLLIGVAPMAMNGFLYKGLKFDVQKSFEPISMVMSAPSVLAVSPALPVRTVADLVALARGQPGRLTFASTGVGGTPHVAGEQFRLKAGVDIVHVPYKGSSGVLTDLAAGHVSMSFITSVGAMPYLTSGRVRPIAVVSTHRLPLLPDVPTLAEAGVPGLQSDSWNGLMAPAGTPAPVIARLQAEVARAVASPEMRDRLVPQGAVLVGDTSAEFRARIHSDVDYWSKVAKTLNISPE